MEFHNKQLLDYALFAFERKELETLELDINSVTLYIKSVHTMQFRDYQKSNLDEDFKNLYNILKSKNKAKVYFTKATRFHIEY